MPLKSTLKCKAGFILTRFAVSESPLHGMGQSDQQLRCAVQYRTIHFFYFWRHAYESARTPPLLRKLQHQRRAAILGAGRKVALCGSHRLTAESKINSGCSLCYSTFLICDCDYFAHDIILLFFYYFLFTLLFSISA